MKPESEFFRNKKNKARGCRAYWCRECRNEWRRERRKKLGTNPRKQTRKRQEIKRVKPQEIIVPLQKLCKEFVDEDKVQCHTRIFRLAKHLNDLHKVKIEFVEGRNVFVFSNKQNHDEFLEFVREIQDEIR